jgi:hypothetical protein
MAMLNNQMVTMNFMGNSWWKFISHEIFRVFEDLQPG